MSLRLLLLMVLLLLLLLLLLMLLLLLPMLLLLLSLVAITLSSPLPLLLPLLCSPVQSGLDAVFSDGQSWTQVSRDLTQLVGKSLNLCEGCGSCARAVGAVRGLRELCESCGGCARPMGAVRELWELWELCESCQLLAKLSVRSKQLRPSSFDRRHRLARWSRP